MQAATPAPPAPGYRRPGAERRGLAGGMLAVSVWGLAPVATRALVGHLPPLALLAARFLLASLVLAPWALPVFRRAGLRDAARLTLAGTLGTTGYYLPITVGLRWLPASTAGLLLATEPVFVLALSRLVFADRIGPRAWAGSAIALAGVGALAGPAAVPHGGSPRTLLGAGLVLAGTLAFSGYTIAVRPLSQQWGPLPATAASTILGAIPYLGLTGTALAPHLTGMPPLAWGELGFLALGSTVCGTILWNHAVTTAGSTRASLLLYLEPLVSVAGAIALLAEHLTATTIAGGALIMTGVITANRSHPPAARPHPPRAAVQR